MKGFFQCVSLIFWCTHALTVTCRSVRATAGKIIVNVDTTAAVLYVAISFSCRVASLTISHSYKAIDLLGAAMEVLGARDVRELNRLCTSSEQFQKLRSFLKGVLVVVKPGDRVKRIHGLVRQGGREEFDKDGRKIAAAVCHPLFCFRSVVRRIHCG